MSPGHHHQVAYYYRYCTVWANTFCLLRGPSCHLLTRLPPLPPRFHRILEPSRMLRRTVVCCLGVSLLLTVNRLLRMRALPSNRQPRTTPLSPLSTTYIRRCRFFQATSDDCIVAITGAICSIYFIDSGARYVVRPRS